MKAKVYKIRKNSKIPERPDKDIVRINRPYMMKLDWNPQWGFSTRRMSSNFKMLG